jgi:hypothetical protein
MAFMQKISTASVRNFGAILNRAQAGTVAPAKRVDTPHLALVKTALRTAANESTQAPQFQQKINDGLQLGFPKQARQKAVELQRRQQALLGRLNSSLPSQARLQALSILPPEAFQNDIGRFLMLACNFFACSPENTVVTPATAEAAEFLGLPFIDPQIPDQLISNTLSKLQWLRETVIVEHRRTSIALQQGDLSQLLKSNERQLAYRQDLTAIVQDMAIARCSKATWEDHERHFRTEIQSV